VATTVPVMFDSTHRCHAQGTAQNRRGCPIEQFRRGRAEYFALPKIFAVTKLELLE
jgi:hypothetical protein